MPVALEMTLALPRRSHPLAHRPPGSCCPLVVLCDRAAGPPSCGQSTRQAVGAGVVCRWTIREGRQHRHGRLPVNVVHSGDD
eukprot:scaffold161020_cov31-Tisochrysis_lutea.AAC.5